MLIPCHMGRVDGANTTGQAGFWGSILPAVWSYMLALRARGLGSGTDFKKASRLPGSTVSHWDTW